MDANYAKSSWVSYDMPEQSIHAWRAVSVTADPLATYMRVPLFASCPSVCMHVAKLLGFDDFVPPFSGASSQQLLRGANFASAAAGIREETGQQLVRTHGQNSKFYRACMHGVLALVST
jgi:hypothetical protein